MTAPLSHDWPAAGASPAAAGLTVLTVLDIEPGAVAPDPDQPRRGASEARLDLLAADLRARGVIEPLIVRPHPDPSAPTPYMLVVGERRWTAARRAALATIPVLLRTDLGDPAERLMLQMAENDGDLREELTLHERAQAVARAFALSGLHQAEFARRHQRSRNWMSQMLTFANAGGLAADALREGRLDGILAARTFLRLPPAEQQRVLVQARRDNAPITLALAEKAASRVDRARPTRRRPADDDLADPDPTHAADSADSADPSDPAGLPSPAAAADPAAPADDPNDAGAPPAPAAFPAAVHPAAMSAAHAAPALRQAGAAPSSFPAGTPSPRTGFPAAPRSAAAGFLDAGETLARGRLLPAIPGALAPRDRVPRVTVELTLPELERLLALLGLEPEGSPQHQVRQLLDCL